MSLLDHLQHLSPPTTSTVALAVAVLALVVHEPLSGRRSYARFRTEEAVEGEPARIRFYRSWTIQGYVTAAVAVVLVLALPGVGLADLGFRLPGAGGIDGPGLTGGLISPATAAGLVVGALLAVAGLVVAALRGRQRSDGRPAGGALAAAQSPQGQLAAVLPMLPRTRAGRRGWAHLSLSAGVTEEITYRGLVLLALSVLLPATTSQLTLVVLAAALFGIAHAYQGWAGVLSTGLVGAVLAALYLWSGSLLVPVVLHVLIDLRALLVPVPTTTGAPDATAPTGPADPPPGMAPSSPAQHGGADPAP